MKIPNKIKVGAIIYKVKSVGNPTESTGLLNREKNIIEVDENMPKNQQELAFIHEVFHALNGELGEETVDFLAQGWHQILSENNLLEKGKGKSK